MHVDSDASASVPRPPLTVGDLIEMVTGITDAHHVTIGVRLTLNGSTITINPYEAFVAIHRDGLVELTIDLANEAGY